MRHLDCKIDILAIHAVQVKQWYGEVASHFGADGCGVMGGDSHRSLGRVYYGAHV